MIKSQTINSNFRIGKNIVSKDTTYNFFKSLNIKSKLNILE